MKSLELSFQQVLQQWELTSEHNVKVLGAKTSEIRELLQVADQKCLYAHDLVDMIDSSSAELRQRLNLVGEIPAGGNVSDLKLRRDFHDLMERLGGRISLLEGQTAEMRQIEELLAHQVKALANQQRSIPSTVENVRESISKIPPDIRLTQPTSDSDRPAPNYKPVVAGPPQWDPETAGRLKPVLVSQKSSQTPVPVIEELLDTQFPNSETPHVNDLLEAKPGTPFHDVLRLFQQGVSVPQIARNLKLGKGEVELVLKLYGNRASMRKVI